MAESVGITILTGGAGQAAGSLVGPATEAGKGIFNSLKRKYDYIKNLDQNYEKLNMEARYLSSREKDVNELISRNKVIMEKTHECDTWLQDVGRMTRILEDLKTRYQKSSHGSCAPCRLYTRLNLSRETVKMTNSVVDLRDRMNLEHILLTERNPDRVEKKYPKKIHEVPSLSENVEKLLEYLKVEDIKRIGIYGMPGVGKTTILENLNDEVEKVQIFDIVIWVTVSKEVSLLLIQQTILKRLSMKVEGGDCDIENQATLISKSLENKKYLLLLDEVFSKVDLRRVGIYDGHLNGKVVIATRERVICDLMETNEEIKVERLSRDDARKMFRDAVGEAVDHPHIKPIAERVLKQCGELPQVIRAVGRHLKDKLNEDLWHNTLSKLRSPNTFQMKDTEDVFNVFKVAYEELHGTLRDCLLYGASFPEDHEIYRDYLVECWKAEELIGIGETFRTTRVEGHSYLETLIDRCLFDRCRSTKYVKMPIIFRNTALRMASQHKLLVRESEEIENHPPVAKWANAKVISLVNSNLNELPDKPECFMISTLFLQKNEDLSAIPISFFECMSTLKILDLCGTSIKFLPPSISNLINLRGLYLNDCKKLVHLPEEVEHLQNLEVLDIRRTGIQGLCTVIGNLTCLRCLRLSFTSSEGNQNHVGANGTDVIRTKIIEKLPQLEELTIDADPKEPRWNEIAPGIAAELANLEKLSTLSFYFPSTESLETFTKNSISWKNGTSRPGNNLRSFNIYVGSFKTEIETDNPLFDVSNCSGHRYLHYKGGKDTPNVIKDVLKRACAFELIGHHDITNLSDFSIDAMECLEICLVEGCITLENIIEDHVPDTPPAFPWLRKLHLLNLQRLNDICPGPVSPGSFARLTTLTLFDCPNVIKVVSWEMAKQLCELQHLKVGKCCQVREIIEVDAQCSETGGVFPKLKIIELVMLEGLVSIISNDSFQWRDLQKIEIIECDKLVNLCLSTMNTMKLRSIRCSEAWWEALTLNEEVKAHLQGFCFFVRVN